MAYFADAAEVDKYIGGVFRLAADHPESGPKLKAANLIMRVLYTDPNVEMNVVMREQFKIVCRRPDRRARRCDVGDACRHRRQVLAG